MRPNYLVTCFGCRLHRNPRVSSLLPSLPEEPYETLNSDSSLDMTFFLCLRDSLRQAECKQNLCNQRDVTIWIKLDPVSRHLRSERRHFKPQQNGRNLCWMLQLFCIHIENLKRVEINFASYHFKKRIK